MMNPDSYTFQNYYYSSSSNQPSQRQVHLPHPHLGGYCYHTSDPIPFGFPFCADINTRTSIQESFPGQSQQVGLHTNIPPVAYYYNPAMVFPAIQQPSGVYAVDQQANTYYGIGSSNANIPMTTSVIVSDPGASSSSTSALSAPRNPIPQTRTDNKSFSPAQTNKTRKSNSKSQDRKSEFVNTTPSNGPQNPYPNIHHSRFYNPAKYSSKHHDKPSPEISEINRKMGKSPRTLPDSVIVQHKEHVNHCQYTASCGSSKSGARVPASKNASSSRSRDRGAKEVPTVEHATDKKSFSKFPLESSLGSSSLGQVSGIDSRKASSGVSSMMGPPKYNAYMPLCEVQRGMKKGEIIEGVLRINPRNYEDSFISAPEGLLDIYISGKRDRNRAMNGDVVAVRNNPVHEWKFREPSKYTNLLATSSAGISSDYVSELEVRQLVSAHLGDLVSSSLVESIQEKYNTKEIKLENSISQKSRCDQPIMTPIEDLDSIMPQEAAASTPKPKKIRKRRSKRKSKAACLADQDDIEDDGINENEKESLSKSDLELVACGLNKLSLSNSIEVAESLSAAIAKGSTYESLIDKIARILREQKIIDRVQITGNIVCVLNERHTRIAGGRLKIQERNTPYALFSPSDSRVPRMRIPLEECPTEFALHPEHFFESLFVAKLIEWPENESMPLGRLVSHLGNAGDIEAESQMLLMEYDIDTSEFPPEVYDGLPVKTLDDTEKWTVPDEERNKRRDFTRECVFTIDPKTARDLDDALSIEEYEPGIFRVGVHIADVSYFVREGMPLDEVARKRSTSTYLVQRVIPMLPRVLCEKLCSLNPGEDKLTFSVEWLITEDGEILQEWFGKSIINSCVKLSYELAQDMIDSPNRMWELEELPQIYGQWSPRYISKSVNLLSKLSKKLRARRFENGALKIDKIKLAFDLDKNTGLPRGFSPYTLRQSNKLVEEFMLLANISVAKKIYQAYPDLALLRRHPEPEERTLREFTTWCEMNNMQVDTSSSGAIMKSLEVILNEHEGGSTVATLLLLKSMALAGYFCSGTCKENFSHYALSVPLYTHFTSPIRRYPDVIVHRMLDAALSHKSLPIRDSPDILSKLAEHCNDMKYRARMVSDSSMTLFLHIYYKTVGPVKDDAVVYQILDRAVDVILESNGNVVRIPMDCHSTIIESYQQLTPANELPAMEIRWRDRQFDYTENLPVSENSQQVSIIRVCDKIQVQVGTHPADLKKLVATLIHPSGESLDIKQVFMSKPDPKTSLGPHNAKVSKSKEGRKGLKIKKDKSAPPAKASKAKKKSKSKKN